MKNTAYVYVNHYIYMKTTENHRKLWFPSDILKGVNMEKDF